MSGSPPEANTKTQPERSNPSSAMDEGRFPPGTLLNQRYRIAVGSAASVLCSLTRAGDSVLRFTPNPPELVALSGLRQQFGILMFDSLQGISNACALLLFLFGLRVLIRKEWIAAVITSLLVFGYYLAVLASTWPTAAAAAAVTAMLAACMLRFGFLTIVFAILYITSINSFPPDLHFTNWYWSSRLASILFIASLMLWAYRAATFDSKGVQPSDLD